MRNVRFVLLVVAVLALVSVSLVSAQQTTVRLAGWSSSDAENAALEAMVAAFEEANPDINVELTFAPEYETFMQTGFASGDYPEVFYVDSFRLQDWASAGVLEPYGDQITEPDDIYVSLRDIFTYEEQLYCAPKDFSTLALVYNTDLFEAAGLNAPTNWEEFVAAAEALTSGDVVGLTTGIELPRFLPLLYQNGGAIFAEDGTIGLNSEEAVGAVDAFLSFYTNGFAKSPADLGAGWAGEAFGQGKAAMTIEGNWIIQYLFDQFPDTNWAVAELPVGPAGPATMAFTVCYGVAAAANNANLEASIKLADFLTGPEGAQMVAAGGFGPMPARASAAEAWLTARGEEFAPFVAGGEYSRPWSFPPGFGSFIDAFNNGLNEGVKGNLTAAEVVEQAAEAAQEALEESM
ncbi:MAG: extracellular solute-binding protein [Anaerolineae bacterium]|nr:extracellular solute-binding protein [Anaerolineae bacterium]